MTDREVMLAIYKAIEKLYLELTGKPLVITLDTETGRITIGVSAERATAGDS